MPHIPGHPLSPSIQQLIDAGRIPDIFEEEAPTRADPGTNVFGQPIGTPGPLDAPPDVFAPSPTGTAPFLPSDGPGLFEQTTRALPGSVSRAIERSAERLASKFWALKDLPRAGEWPIQEQEVRFLPDQAKVDEIITSLGYDPEAIRANPDKSFQSYSEPDKTWYTGTGEEILAMAVKTERYPPPEGGGGILADVMAGMLTLGMGEPDISLQEAGSPLFTAMSAVPGGTIFAAPVTRGLGMFGRSAWDVWRGAGAARQPATGAPRLLGETVVRSIDEASRGRQVVQPSSLSRNVLGLNDIQIGLTRSQELSNVAKEVVGERLLGPVNDPIVTAAMDVRTQARHVADSQSSIIGARQSARLNKAFDINDRGQIPSLAGIDDTLVPGRPDAAPTIADVAARLPHYWPSLSPARRRAMNDLRADLAPYRRLYIEVGGELRTRNDIMEGGFYVPRGNALEEGADVAFRVRPVRPGGSKPSFDKGAVFESQAEGIHAGYEYRPLGDSIGSHVLDISNRSADHHVVNFLKTVTDPDTGMVIGLTSQDLVPNDLRIAVTRLRRQVQGRHKTLRRRVGVSTTLSREAARAEQRAGRGADRVMRAADRAESASFDASEITRAREDLRRVIEESQNFATRLGETTSRLKAARVELSASDRRLIKESNALTVELATARAAMDAESAGGSVTRPISSGSLSGTVNAHLREASRIERSVGRLWKRANKMSDRVDDLIERGDVLNDMRQGARDDLVQANRALRVLNDRNMTLGRARRELSVLEAAHRREVAAATAAGQRAGRASARMDATEREIARFKQELGGMADEWNHAIRESQETPTGYARISDPRLPGLRQVSFPQAMVNAAEKELQKEAAATGFGARYIQTAQALNSLYRGLNATYDNSALGIQGLMAAFNNQKAWGRALRINARSWADPDVLGRFLDEFDSLVVPQGRQNALAWGRDGLHVGGRVSEMALTGGPERIPVLGAGVRAANRAYGYFGDSLRLSWADDELERLMRQTGRSLDDLVAAGETRRIAQAINGGTGWSPDRFAGDLGEFAMFAPRFFQSRLETVARAGMGLRPGAPLEQRIARRSLLKMIGIGTLMTVSINALMSDRERQERLLTPWRDTDFALIKNGRMNPNFMRVRAFGRDWSLFGTWDSLLRLMVGTAMGRPHDAWQGVASGVVTMGRDLIFNEAFDGSQTRGEEFPWINSEAFVSYIFQSMLPFVAEEAPEAVEKTRGGDYGASAALVLGEAIGIKSSPMTQGEERDELRRQAMQEMGLVGNFYDQSAWHKDEINALPEIARLSESILARGVERGYESSQWTDRNNKINETFDHHVTALFKKVGRSKEFRNGIRRLYREMGLKKTINNNEFKEALEGFSERDPSSHPLNISIARYAEVMFAEGMEDMVTGYFDFKERERRLDQLRQPDELGETMLEEVERYFDSNAPDHIQELRAAQDELQDYFSVTPDTFEWAGLTDDYERYKNATEEGQRYIELKNPIGVSQDGRAVSFNDVLNNIAPTVRREWRKQRDKKYDRLLVLWGWEDRHVHQDLIDEDLRGSGTPVQ